MMKAVALLPLDQQLKPILGPHYPVVITPQRLHGAKWEVKRGAFIWPGGQSLQPFPPSVLSPGDVEVLAHVLRLRWAPPAEQGAERQLLGS